MAKIILLKDIPKLGKKFDTKEVKSGYARNFLIPKGLAMIANKPSLAKIDAMKKKVKTGEEALKNKAKEIAKQLKDFKIEIQKKVTKKGKLFGSVNGEEIKKALKNKGFEIPETAKVSFKKPLKEAGDYEVTIDFGRKEEAKILVSLKKDEQIKKAKQKKN